MKLMFVISVLLIIQVSRFQVIYHNLVKSAFLLSMLLDLPSNHLIIIDLINLILVIEHAKTVPFANFVIAILHINYYFSINV